MRQVRKKTAKTTAKTTAKITGASIKGLLADTFELPKEIVLNMPKITIIGNVNIFLENHKGLIEYGVNHLRINTGNGIISMEGSDMVIDEVTSENLFIRGSLKRIDFDMR